MHHNIRHNVSLRHFNTFGLEAKARYYVAVQAVEELQALVQDPDLRKLPWLILGGGSNVLLTQDFPGLVIHNRLLGKEVVREDEHHAWVRAESGEVWHELVLFALENGLGGIENLSLIPGMVGAAPMQNIGAYGVELQEVFEELEAVSLEAGKVERFDAAACRFGYRESVFKHELKGQYFITAVTLRLAKEPVLNTSYGAIQQTLEERGITEPTAKEVSEAVISIRQSKLPDPQELGNSGSFFKNPVVPQEQFEQLQEQHPKVPHYPAGEGLVKVPAGWLIEQAGWKGKRVGNTGSHVRQSLVLVNYGDATGAEVWALAKEIQQSVKEQFGIELQPEVNII